MKWKGLTLMKDPMSLSIYLQLIQDVRPKTILEFGTYEGGSALWMLDQVSMLGFECDIHTFDINAQQVKLPDHKNLFFHQLDNHCIAQYVEDNHDMLSNLEGPILMIEDSHVNVGVLLESMDPFLATGDYLIVEDTISINKYDEMLKFLLHHPYFVDTFYCDFWGTNNSWNINSFLIKA